MAEPPTSEWRADYDPAQALLDAPLDARWKRLPGTVRHVFTHFPLELTVFLARVAAGTPAPDGMRFTPRAGSTPSRCGCDEEGCWPHALEQKLAAPPAAPVPPPAPDLATLPEPETAAAPRAAAEGAVATAASAAPVTKPVGRGRPRER